MPAWSTLALFALSALVLCAIPGPAVIYILSKGVQSGRRGALAAVFGVHGGTLLHITAATLGLSALVMSSATAFDAVKLVGAGYLVALGLMRLLRGGKSVVVPAERESSDLRQVFRQGFVVEALNPKTAIFFLAVLPQFADPSRALAPQIVVLGIVWLVVGICTDSLWALLGGTLGDVLARSRRFPLIERIVSGCALIGLGLAAAFTGRRVRAS
jgi:threonine/homoserine/homoserine lactone efflux protein